MSGLDGEGAYAGLDVMTDESGDGESEDGLVKAGEYEDGTAFYFGEFVEWPEDGDEETER